MIVRGAIRGAATASAASAATYQKITSWVMTFDTSERMQKAIEEALKDSENRTKDLGGSAGTKEFAQAVISHL